MGSLVASRTEERSLAYALVGDPSAREELYDRYAAALYGMALRASASQELAESALIATFERFWKDAHRYDRSKGGLFPYIMAIMQGSLLELGVGGERMPLAFGLQERMKLLAPDLFAVYEIRTVQGLSEEQAALDLGLPMEEVRDRWRTALRQLVNFAHQTVPPVFPVGQG